MATPYDQLCPSGNTVSRSPYMRLSSYKSLHRQRYQPYSTTHTWSSSSSTDTMDSADDTDFEVDVPLARVNPIPVSLSLPMILEDDCLAGLRTVVSQMIGRDGTQMRLGSVHLVIDFALIVRSHLRKSGGAVRNEVVVTLPPTTVGLSM